MRDHHSNDSSTGADTGEFLKTTGVESEKHADLLSETMRS